MTYDEHLGWQMVILLSAFRITHQRGGNPARTFVGENVMVHPFPAITYMFSSYSPALVFRMCVAVQRAEALRHLRVTFPRLLVYHKRHVVHSWLLV